MIRFKRSCSSTSSQQGAVDTLSVSRALTHCCSHTSGGHRFTQRAAKCEPTATLTPEKSSRESSLGTRAAASSQAVFLGAGAKSIYTTSCTVTLDRSRVGSVSKPDNHM